MVGFAAGGAADAAARLIAKKLGENIGQTVVVDNKAGAGGNIAHQYGGQRAGRRLDAAVRLDRPADHRAARDEGAATTRSRTWPPVSGGVNFPNVLVVHKGVGVKTLAEFVALAKKKPGSVDFASTGAGSASHLAGELFNQRAGIDMVHVPYKGGAPALQDLLGGRIASYFSAPPTALPHVEAGKLVPLATTGLTRPAYLPNIPTVAESGYPGLRGAELVCVRRARQDARADPRPLEPEIVKVLNDPGVKEALEQARSDPAADHACGTGCPHEEGRRQVERHRA